jgi:hypothetical protein
MTTSEEDIGRHAGNIDDCWVYYDGCHCPEALIQSAIDIVQITYDEPWEEGGEAKIALSKALQRLIAHQHEVEQRPYI